MFRIFALLPSLALLLVGPALAQEPPSPNPSANPNIVSYVFDITRDGNKIGSDTLDITKDGDTTTAKIGTKISVVVAFIEVYHFDHSAVEIWKNGKFVSYEAETDANGTKYNVSETASDDGKINLTVNGEAQELAQLAVPATFWNSDFVNATQVIDADKGKVLAVQVQDLGEEPIDMNGQQVQAHHYQMTGELKRDIWLVNDMAVRIKLRGSDNSQIVSDLRPATAE
ncbi:MAG: DUF6134 family protein [Methylovirgula sp.]|jgi:hypothetical protein